MILQIIDDINKIEDNLNSFDVKLERIDYLLIP